MLVHNSISMNQFSF